MSIFGQAALDLPPDRNLDTRSASGNALKHTSFAEILTGRTEQLTAPISSESTPKVHDSNGFLDQLWLSGSTNTSSAAERNVKLDRPTQFVQSIANSSKRAADQLGTSTAAVIAIAAHETGWGKHVINTSELGNSHNLFGIKATGAQTSHAVMAKTTEYINGESLTLRQPFRRYESTDDSVADFANFIQSNPRYSTALVHASDANAFIDQIHLAGYATDPEYPSKVKQVMAQVESILNSAHVGLGIK